MTFTKPTFASITADFTKKIIQLEQLIEISNTEVDDAEIAIAEAEERRSNAIAEKARANALKNKIVNLLN